MAKRKKSKASRCKVVSVCGKRRRLCWVRKGKLTSNTKA